MSTLLIIIAIVFVSYYYLHKPQLPVGPLPVPQPMPGDIPIGPLPVPQPMPSDIPIGPLPVPQPMPVVPDNGLTMLELEDVPQMGSGNVRPDNVMLVEEHLTYV